MTFLFNGILRKNRFLERKSLLIQEKTIQFQDKHKIEIIECMGKLWSQVETASSTAEDYKLLLFEDYKWWILIHFNCKRFSLPRFVLIAGKQQLYSLMRENGSKNWFQIINFLRLLNCEKGEKLAGKEWISFWVGMSRPNSSSWKDNLAFLSGFFFRRRLQVPRHYKRTCLCANDFLTLRF